MYAVAYRVTLKKWVWPIAVALGLLVLHTNALAHGCPGEMRKIDVHLSENPTISPELRKRVDKLRAEGERLHLLGRHAESMLVLGSAKRLLGIE